MIDTYWEHEQHFEYDPQCSECFSEKNSAIKVFREMDSPRKIDWELLEERSIHPEDNYWQ